MLRRDRQGSANLQIFARAKPEAACRVIPKGQFLVHAQRGGNLELRYRCPCCGFRTLTTVGAQGLCPVCWWEDDGQEEDDASEPRLTVNGQLSLEQAREHYLRCGAAHPRFLPYVRKPEVTEQ